MTSRMPSQCLSCTRWTSSWDDQASSTSERQTCRAFPAGIPEDLWWNRVDHRQEHDGDGGLRWAGIDFPQWAMGQQTWVRATRGVDRAIITIDEWRQRAVSGFSQAEWSSMQRADYFNIRWPKGTPGGKGGQFKGVGSALEDWMNGFGGDDPLAGFTAVQLRAAAKRLGVELPKGAKTPDIRKALMDKAVADVRAQRDENRVMAGTGHGTLYTPPVGTRRELPGGYMVREPSPGAKGEAGHWSHDGTKFITDDRAPADVWAVYRDNGELVGHVSLPSEARALLDKATGADSTPVGTRLQLASGASAQWDGQAWQVTIPRQQISGEVFDEEQVGAAATTAAAKALAADASAKRPKPVKGRRPSSDRPTTVPYTGPVMDVQPTTPRKLSVKEKLEEAVAAGRITSETAVRLLQGDLAPKKPKFDKATAVSFVRALVMAGEITEMVEAGADRDRLRTHMARQNTSTLRNVARVFELKKISELGHDGIIDALVAHVLPDAKPTPKGKSPREAAVGGPTGGAKDLTDVAAEKASTAAEQYKGVTASGVQDLADMAAAVSRGEGTWDKLYGGQSAVARVATLPDGRKVVHKGPKPGEAASDNVHQADAEQLTSLLAKALDAPAARVYRDGRTSVWMEHVDGKHTEATTPVVDSVDGRRLGLLDALSANFDRADNWLSTTEGPVGIDHGWNWAPYRLKEGAKKPQVRSPFAAPYAAGEDTWSASNPLSPEDIPVIRERLETLRPEFAKLRRERWLNWSLKVLDELGKRADGEGLYVRRNAERPDPQTAILADSSLTQAQKRARLRALGLDKGQIDALAPLPPRKGSPRDIKRAWVPEYLFRSGLAGRHTYKDQPRDPGGEGGGQWVESPLADLSNMLVNADASKALAFVADAAGRDDLDKHLAGLRVDALKAVLGHVGLPKTGKKAELIDRLAKHVKNGGNAKADADEPLRPDGKGSLVNLSADGVRPDGRPGAGELLHGNGGSDRPADSGIGGRPRGDGPAGRDVPGSGGPAELGDVDREGAGVAGDPSSGGGGRPDEVGAGVGDSSAGGGTLNEAPVFRPGGQHDLAPNTPAKRLDANLEALRTLRKVQAENRPATAAEQKVLARYSGWGSLKNVFADRPPSRRYAEAQSELKGSPGKPGLLNDAEYADARRSVQYAHYTDAGYVQAVWKALDGLGFDGGRVLEPGSGTGNFAGFAPDNAHMVGVEVEPVTAAIAKALYPNADIRNESFADTRVHEGEFDAAVGNVPFSGTKLFDKEHNPGRKHSMHNHFIIKSLRGVRPGGLVAILTSRYTMDSATATSRREMAKLGDLVGAVRLPSSAHRDAAGTDVVTDLLVFRRRDSDAKPAGLPFVKVKEVDVDGTKVAVNEAFVDHPEMVLGKYELGGLTPGAIQVVAGPGADPQAKVRAALDAIVARANADGLTMTPRETPLAPLPDAGGRSTRRPDGYLQANADGTFTRVINGAETAHDVPKSQAAELRALLDVRDTLDRLLDVEATAVEDTPEMAQLRTRLNRVYDDYVKKYGWVNRFTQRPTGRKVVDPETGDEVDSFARTYPAQGGFASDPSAASVKALEHYDPIQGTGRKADIFSKRVVAPRTPRTSADTADEALAITLDQHGRVDLDNVAKLLGKDPQTARQMLGDLVYADPSSDGDLVPRAEYLSGDVRDKLAVAKRAAADDKSFEANVAALETVLPADLKPDDIRAQLGATWIDRKYVEQFLRELLNDPNLVVEHTHGTSWKVTSRRKNTVEATNQWGIPEYDAAEIAENLLTLRPIKVYDTDKESRRLNRANTEAAQAKGQEMNDRFAEWVWQNPERADELANTYNRMFNSMVTRRYDEDGRRLTLPGMSTLFKPHDHVKAAVARVTSEPSVGLWHEVGAGKTAEMVISAMELRRLGLVRKPAVVVPNHMLEQFRNEFLEIYPQARVLAASSQDLGGDKRREFVARAATGDWDAVILTQGAFERIPVSAETQDAYLRKEMAELQQALADAKANASPGDKNADRSIAKMEKLKEAAEQRIKENVDKSAKDPSITFEQTGIDYLFVDEAHTYKNLRRMSAIDGMSHPGNGVTTDLATKIDYLRAKHRPDVTKLGSGIATEESDWANPKKGSTGSYLRDAQAGIDAGLSPREVADRLAAEVEKLRDHAEDTAWQEEHGTDEDGLRKKARRVERLADRIRGAKSGRVVTLATATPIANSMGEAHTMMRYLRPDLLQAMDVEVFDKFVASFGQVVSNVEPAPEGGMRLKARLAKFVNVPELQRSWWIAGDVKTSDDLFGPAGSERRRELRIPEVRGGKPEVEVVPASEELKSQIAELGARAKEIRNRRGKVEKGDDIILNITAEGRAAALDLRLVGRHTDEPSKLDVAAENIFDIWQQTRDKRYRVNPKDPASPEHPTPGALQFVFADIGTPKTEAGKARKAATKAAKKSDDGGFTSPLTDFDAYEELRRKLVAKGMPRDKIRFIHEAKTDKDKQKLFADARDGRVAVLVGSTGKMGTGTNAQNRAVALHHLDVPWRPADVQQREGRIIRQGNQNPEVRIIRYVTEGSFDSYNWGVIARKAGFIHQMMSGKTAGRELEDVGDSQLSASEAMALAAGRPELIEHARTQAELARLERLQRSYESNLKNLRSRITSAEQQITTSQKETVSLDAAIAHRNANVAADGKFAMTVLGSGWRAEPTTYDNRAEANDALRRRVTASRGSFDKVGELGGFAIYAARQYGVDHAARMDLRDSDGGVVPGTTVLLSQNDLVKGDLTIKLQNRLKSLESVRDRHQQIIGEQRDRITKAHVALGEPFKDESNLAVVRAKFQELDEALRAAAEEATKKANMGGKEGDRARALLAFLGDDRDAAEAFRIADVKARLESGGGFADMDELRAYLSSGEADAGQMSGGKGLRFLAENKAALAPEGRLLVHKNPHGVGYAITEARTLRSLGPAGETGTMKAAVALASALETSGVPWNTHPGADGSWVKTWRSPEGASATELVARARAGQPGLDKTGTWKNLADKLKLERTDGLSGLDMEALLALAKQHGLATYGDRGTLLARLRAAGVTVAAPGQVAVPAGVPRGIKPADVRVLFDALSLPLSHRRF